MIDPTDVELPPLTDGVLELVLRERHPFGKREIMPCYVFSIILLASGEEVGTLLLRVDGHPSIVEFVGHIAYEIHPEHRGRTHAARACVIVRPLARVHLEVAWIMIAPNNPASIRSAERIGARYVDTRAVPETSDIRAQGIHEVRRYAWTL